MSPKDPAAVSLGRKGGKARVRNQSAEERTQSAKRAADARWAKTKALVDQITEGSKALLSDMEKNARLRKAKLKKAKKTS